MKKISEKKWFFPLAVAFFLCVILIGIRLTYGAYIRRSYVKSVIATNETEKLFGSNLLYGVKNQPNDPESDDWLSVYPYTVSNPDQSNITIPLKIYNYLAEDEDRVNQLDVNYIISFKVSGNPTSGNLTGYSINGHNIGTLDTVYYLGTSGLTTTEGNAKNQTLPGRLPKYNSYSITIPGEDLGKVSIAVKAKRVQNENGNYGTDLLYLAARVVPSLASTVQTATVKGDFTYRILEKPKDYDAYNYTIELTGAPTAVVLKWNNSLVELDPFFNEKYGVNPEDSKPGEVIFNMEPGIHTVQFYRKGNVQDKGWKDLGVTVSER